MEHNQGYDEDNYNHVIAGLIYITTSCPGSGLDMDLYNSMPKGCKCIGFCQKGLCSCFLRYNMLPLAPDEDFIPATHSTLGPITECNDDCNCGKNCFNRIVQNGPRLGLEIVNLGAKGFGLVTKSVIPNGSFVCEYAGEIITIREAVSRFELAPATNINYILILREHSGANDTNITVIDPTVIGNIGRYINHSCQPNTIVVPVRINNLIPVAALFASRTIEVGEEISYDYDSFSHTAEIQYSLELDKDTLHSSSSSSSELAKNSLSKVGVIPGMNLNVSNYHKRSYSKRPCLCLSQHCRQFLPSNSTLFHEDV